MTYSADQIEKHTLVLRLSVSIYKMDLKQLGKLLNLLDPETDGFMGQSAGVDSGVGVGRRDEALQRQMIIARIFVVISQLDRETLLERLQRFNYPDFRWVREFPRIN